MKNKVELIKKLKTFNMIEKECDELYRSIALKHNMSESSFWILYEVRLNECSLTQTDLCKKSFLPKQTINSSLKLLEEKGLLRLSLSENNKKNKLISLTDEGINFSKRIIDDVIETEMDILNSFSENELNVFFNVHHNYVKNLKERMKVKNENSTF